jgi:cytochrome c peroxidase
MLRKIYFIILIVFLFSCANISKKEEEASQVLLGRHLFYDQRLSYNSTKSCSSCHDPKFAFTDGYKKSIGIYGDLHQRNTLPLFNLSTTTFFTRTDSTKKELEQQMDNPLFNQHPPEMGLKGHEEEVLNRLSKENFYHELLAKAFPKQKLSFSIVKKAIATFVKTIQSYNSPYDAYKKRDSNAISISAKNGMQLFFSNKLKCSHCHGGDNFNIPIFKTELGQTVFYYNIGLYNIDANSSYPILDQGMYQHTQQKKDMGKFKVPTLRNLFYTAPYYHDGSEADLGKVIDNYANGGRVITSGINKGDGLLNQYKHTAITGFPLTAKEKKDLINFLFSLNDSSFIQNKSYSNPFVQ